MIKANEILIKPIGLATTFKSNQTKNVAKTDEKNITELSNMPVQEIGIKTPSSYKETGNINITDELIAKTYKLSNGQKIILLPKKGTTFVKSYVNVGSMNEPDNLRGISHYIEHNLFNGTPNIKAGEFFNKVNKMGASTNASTSFAITDYYISSQLLKQGDLEEKIKLHADMLQNPVFAPDMLEKERGPVISEISMVMDEPKNIAINKAIKNLYQIDTKSTDLIAGTIDNIKNITREDVTNYYNTHYSPNNITTVITGDINPEETINLIAKYFTKQPPQKPFKKKYENTNPIKQPIRVEESSDKTVSSTIVAAFVGPENNNTKDKIAIETLMTILCGSQHSKLQKTLNKQHIEIESGVEKTGNRPSDTKTILFIANCSKDKSEKALETIYKEIFKVQNGSITQKDLNIAKKQLKMGLANISENSALLNDLIGTAYLDNNIEYVTNFKKILDKLTLDDIQKVAKKYLDLNKISIAAVNPSEKALKQDNKAISFGNKYVKKEVYDTSNIKTYKLNNNIEITTNNTSSNIATFNIVLKTELPAAVKPGVTEILSEILNQGSINKNKEKFYDEAAENGIDINFSASPDGITISAQSNPEDIKKALELSKAVLLTPNLNEKTFNFVKEHIKELVAKKQKSAEANAYEQLFNHLPYTASNDNFIKSLEEVTLNDVIGLYEYIKQNSAGICITSAPFKQNPKLLNEFSNSLGNDIKTLKPFKPSIFNTFTPLTKNKIIAQIDERNQADVVKSYKFKTNGNISDIAKFSLLNTILGGTPNSRLFNDLREKQKLAYRVRSNVEYNGNTGVMSLSIKTTTDNPLEGNDKLDNLKKSINGFDKNIENLRKNLVSDEELDNAKLYLKTKILNNGETSAGQTNLLNKSILSIYGVNCANLILQEIDNITKEDIKAAAEYIFKNPSLTSIVASKKTLDYFKSTSK